MSNPKVLIIDDDNDLQAVMLSIASSLGFDADCCDNFEDLKQAYRSDLTVVVIDMLMPTLDGVEVIRFLSEKKSSAGIVLISSAEQKIILAAENLAQGRDLHLIGSLQKPFLPEEFSALLTKARIAAQAQKLHRHPLQNDAIMLPPDDELVVLYQPKINLTTLDFSSVEALVRWQHPEKGLLGPGFFVPAAEANGTIDALTDMVIHKTLSQCNLWMKSGLVLTVSINISTRTLSDLTFPDRLADLLMCYHIKPSQIVLEVTETWLSEDPINCLDSLTRLRLKGFLLSVDDFGTGYSSIAQLSRIPFTELKIDQSFVKQAPKNRQAQKILESSVELGHNLHMKVVAEGVETQEQWDLVTEADCDECQGFFIARPLTGNSTPGWLERWRTMQGQKPADRAETRTETAIDDTI